MGRHRRMSTLPAEKMEKNKKSPDTYRVVSECLLVEVRLHEGFEAGGGLRVRSLALIPEEERLAESNLREIRAQPQGLATAAGTIQGWFRSRTPHG